jgi:hypothetical protein
MERQNPDASASQDTLISLQMVDPAPLPDDESRRNSLYTNVSDIPKPPSKTSSFGSSLGLSGSGHSSVWYRTLPCPIPISQLTNPSNTPPTLLLLRLRDLRHFPHHKHINNTTHNPLRPNLGYIPPSHATLLPIFPLRTTPHYPPNHNTHTCWSRSSYTQAQRKSSTLWSL